jgi:hypothetical protein
MGQFENNAIGNDIFPALEYKYKDTDGNIVDLGESIAFDKKNSTYISCHVTPKVRMYILMMMNLGT